VLTNGVKHAIHLLKEVGTPGKASLRPLVFVSYCSGSRLLEEAAIDNFGSGGSSLVDAHVRYRQNKRTVLFKLGRVSGAKGIEFGNNKLADGGSFEPAFPIGLMKAEAEAVGSRSQA
jgi:hypothetical protein